MKLKLLAGLISLTAVHAATAAVIVVDDFSSASASYPALATVVPVTVSPGADVSAGAIGGIRQVTAQLTSSDLPGLDSLAVGIFPFGPGVYDYASSSGADGNSALLYGASNINSPNLLSLVIPDGSFIKFDVLLFDRPDGGSMKIDVALNNLVPFGVVSTTLAVGGVQTVTIPLDSISPAIRSNTTGISIFLDGSKAVDFRLDAVSIVIPEPSAMALLAPAGLLLTRRRK